MRPVSLKREAENADRTKAMHLVRQRDHNACVGGRWTNPDTQKPFLPGYCYGPLNGHEIITRAQGGSITDPANIVLLCEGHNRWCAIETDEAVARGFRQLRRDPYSSNVATRLPHLSAAARPATTAIANADASAHPPGPDASAEARAAAVIPIVLMRDPLSWAAQEGIEFRGTAS